MTAMKSVNESFTRLTSLGELKALLHKLMTGDIRVTDLDLSPLAVSTHGLPSR